MKVRRIIPLVVIIVAGLFTIAQAELRPAALDQPQPKSRQPKTQPPAQQPTTEANSVKFPYVGEVTGSEINVRSGPGMNYYSCGKINAPMRVIVVDQKYSWSKILPPPGSFSWIFRQYVQTDANNPNVGTVNADNVRVYAGSDEIEPMRSDSIQILLATGQKVRIIGSAVGDYCKIAPPEGATLWTTSQYIKYVRSADEIDIKIPPAESDANAAKPEMIIEQIETQNRWLEQYHALEKQFEDEKAKPLESQDYSKIKAELAALVTDANSGDAGNYAKYLLKNIQRCELAKESTGLLESQKTELRNQLAEIEKSREQNRQNLTDLGKYAIMGIFRHSLIYEGPSARRFLIVDDSNNPICYAEPTGEAADANLTDYYEQKVGLIGRIAADNQSHLALVKFEKIEKIEKEQKKE
jgi:SH3-like domain-containing protein